MMYGQSAPFYMTAPAGDATWPASARVGQSWESWESWESWAGISGRVAALAGIAIGERACPRAYFAYFQTKPGNPLSDRPIIKFKGKSQIVDFQAFDLYRVKDGRIAGNRHLEGNLTLLRQLIAIKPKWFCLLRL